MMADRISPKMSNDEPSSDLEIRVEQDVVIGRFCTHQLRDRDRMDALSSELRALSREYSKVLLNFEGVDYISSLALGALVLINTKMERSGGVLRICNVEPIIQELFEVVNLTRLIEFFPTEQDALQDWLAA